MSGTEWTEPGQGADLADLYSAVLSVHDRTPGRKAARLHIIALTKGTYAAMPWALRTNLRLTGGAPMTTEDLKRIAECSLKRIAEAK